MAGERLLHVAFSDDWEACERFGEYDVATRSTLFDDTGYLHATTAEGLPAVLREVYGDASEPLVLAVIDEAALADQGITVRWEAGAGPDGSAAPRIEGTLQMDGVTVPAVLPVGRDAGGWVAPDLDAWHVRRTPPPGVG
ncbi:DUF952 domain-containing protein [Promicromonospora thailandica]|uniref:Uncharacterized conserved protein, DUF952 family n=1 Tax=Promicromonospora thailandica TaxID=765201 RepID=A0A9X2JW16_9MICO|nr:DUF952 domain-containing protein [Promicromonospora thailandica]MCP2265067.1 Uncharacterized conserved protein, DUF952 family [Promicromonospora thailandica]BFF19876.1 hypothetical protein GCM10025730_33970 [Promicromonospora thailandica]